MKIGTLGGGQLAMMLAEAGKNLGFEIVALVDDVNCPAQGIATLVQGDQNDPKVIEDFANKVDLITFEFENVNLENLENLNLPIHPNISALKIAQDREQEKQAFLMADIPTTIFKIVKSAKELGVAIEEIGFPCVIKTCRDGYDGKGQKVLRAPEELEHLWESLGSKRLIVENLVPFDFEVSLIAVRNLKGECVFYPLTENQHQEGILRVSKAPYDNAELQNLAEKYLRRLLENLNYVGVLVVEFFVVQNTLIANEMAPRVHNSGHWTIEGAKTSQFENHLRAIAGLPLGPTTTLTPTTMVNIIGSKSELTRYQALPNAFIHDYHKSERPGRKLAHVTLLPAIPTQ